jgi:hypothetical protein
MPYPFMLIFALQILVVLDITLDAFSTEARYTLTTIIPHVTVCLYQQELTMWLLTLYFLVHLSMPGGPHHHVQEAKLRCKTSTTSHSSMVDKSTDVIHDINSGIFEGKVYYRSRTKS